MNVNYDVFFFFFLSDLLSHGASILIPTASVLTPQFLERRQLPAEKQPSEGSSSHVRELSE